VEIRKLERNSGSVGLNIPIRYARNLDLKPGDYVKVELTVDRKIIVTKAELTQGERTP
jgi:antitoxin component of MazEF toxin-antitoxin module